MLLRMVLTTRCTPPMYAASVYSRNVYHQLRWNMPKRQLTRPHRCAPNTGLLMLLGIHSTK